jgi:hypothetical protein
MAIQTMETSFLHLKMRKEPFELFSQAKKVGSEALLLQCEVMFGSPSSNCDGNGICKIVARSHHPLQMFKRTDCSHAKALFGACDGGNGASLLFRREWVCSNLMKRHFRHGILEMPEPCSIPSALVATLGLEISQLPAGLHLVEDYGTHFKINFRHTALI